MGSWQGHVGRNSCFPRGYGLLVGLGTEEQGGWADCSRWTEGHMQRPCSEKEREVCKNVQKASVTGAECVEGSEVQSRPRRPP